MLAGQSGKEEKSSTPEVSIQTLIPNSILDPTYSQEAFGVNSLRRRRTIIRSEACDETNDLPLYLEPQAHPVDDSHTLQKLSKTITYPKVTSSYPRILPSNKIHPKEMSKPMKVNPSLSRPPPAHSPIFLKCKFKKKLSSRDIIDQDLENLDTVKAKTTDLDIQLRRLKLESFSMSTSSSLDSKRRPSLPSDNVGQSMTQYCSFYKKKIVKVAPHIRRKDVICDTVDAWSLGHDGCANAKISRCKPLIFGGTYPIDFPFKGKNFKNIGDKNDSLKTFQIDAPINYESEEL